MAIRSTVNGVTCPKRHALDEYNMAANSQFWHIDYQDTAFAHLSSDHAMKRILLVDNQAHVLRVMKSTLDRSGYEVDTAMSADIALAKIREAHFDVLLIDNGLEKLDGQQLIYTINDQLHDRAPAMFLITDLDADKLQLENLQQWCSQFERTECLEKPISISYLSGRLDELWGE